MARTQTPDVGSDLPAELAADQDKAFEEERQEEHAGQEEHEQPSKRQKLNMDKKNKRLITAADSKLGKVDLTVLLSQPDAWSSLPFATRQHLYTLLPATVEGNEAHDPAVNPLGSKFGDIIVEELQIWQEDLKNGYETAKWRNEALGAGRERLDGRYDEWKDAAREEQWGRPEDEENVDPERAEGELDGADHEADGKDDHGSEIVVNNANIKAKRAAASS